VRGSGKLTGTVRYGELELERGGQIAGNISVLDTAGSRAGSSTGSQSKPAPAFGEASLASGGKG
jgi:cytoskeletal protein CcmA (bactofilin family)